MYSFLSYHTFALYGRKCFKIFDPSKGGKGIKLKTPNPILIEIRLVKKVDIIVIVVILEICAKTLNLANSANITVAIIAMKKFISGPANETIA